MTLDGKVIDKVGTMSGGGNKVQRGALSNRIAEEIKPEEVARLQELYKTRR